MKNESLIQLGGKSYIKSRVVMLPTEKASRICAGLEGEFAYSDHDISYQENKDEGFFNQHLYFLSSEGIKKGEYLLNENGIVVKANVKWSKEDMKRLNVWKIIASTDESLIEKVLARRDSIGELYADIPFPRPSPEFLQSFCKAKGKIEEVLVEVDVRMTDVIIGKTEIIGLKVAPDNTITIKRVEEKVYGVADLKKCWEDAQVGARIGVSFSDWLRANE